MFFKNNFFAFLKPDVLKGQVIHNHMLQIFWRARKDELINIHY